MASKANEVLWKYMKKFFPYIILAILFSVGQNYLNLQLPKLLRDLVNDATVDPLTGSFSFQDVDIDTDALINLFLTLVLLFLGSGIFGGLRTIVSQYIGTNVVYGIRSDMYKALQKQSYSYYDKNRTGDIISKATRDVGVSRNFLANQFANLIRDVFTLAILLFEVFRINWELSLIFLSLVPILFGLMIWYRRSMYDYYIHMSKKSGSLTSTLEENVSGYRVVKAFAREKHELAKFKKDNDKYLKANLKISKLTSTYGPSQELVTQIGSVLVLFLGAKLVIDGEMKPGDVIAFYVYFALLYDPIRGIVNRVFKYSQVQGSLTRINSILQNKSEIVEAEDPVILKEIEGEYNFEDVWFSYDEDDNYALKNINLNVKPGESIAIIGATGSGKSTFINLVPRFYDPTKGRITLDGVDLKDLSIDDYRKKIGIVSQDIFLFSRSIRENIAYGVEGNISDEEIEKVAKIASIHNFITSLPKGYKSMVGERGQTLSGGQKQRVAIARALLSNPDIIILDDSLSAVDIDTEAHIQNALDELFTSTTTFIITQRISTIKNCDRIMVLDYGEIVELGTHDKLYELGGIYTKIYDTMFKANTKRLEKAEKRKEELFKMLKTSVIDFEDLGVDINDDIESLRELYKEKYPDEEEREKQFAKLLKRVEKRRSKSDRKLLKKNEKQYKIKLINLLRKRNIVEISEVKRRFYVSKPELVRILEKWEKEIPYELKEETLVAEDPETFEEETDKILSELKQEMKEEKRKEILKDEKQTLKDKKEYYIRKLIESLEEKPEILIGDLADKFQVHKESLDNRLRFWKRRLPIEVTDEVIRIENMEDFNEDVEELEEEWEEEKKKKYFNIPQDKVFKIEESSIKFKRKQERKDQYIPVEPVYSKEINAMLDKEKKESDNTENSLKKSESTKSESTKSESTKNESNKSESNEKENKPESEKQKNTEDEQ